MTSHTNVPDEVLDNLHLEEGEPIADARQEMPELLDDIRRLLVLRQQRDELSAQAEPVANELEAIQQKVIERMSELGMDSLKLEGYTLSRTTTRWPSIREGCKAQVIAALQAMGFGDTLVTVNHSALKSRLTEWEKQGTTPSGFDQWINVFDKFGLSIRKVR